MSEVAQRFVGRLLGLGFQQDEIEFYITGPWAAQPDLGLEDAKLILPKPDPLGEVRNLSREEIEKNHNREGLRDIIEMATGDRPANRVNKSGLMDQLMAILEGNN